MILVIDIISLLAILVMWFLTVLYIVVIKKYGYDEYSRSWDSFKLYYSTLLIVFIGISIWRAITFFQSDKIYSIISIVLLVFILCCLSVFYIFRIIIERNESLTKKKKSTHQKKRKSSTSKKRRIDTSKITVKVLEKVVITTSAAVLVYFIYTWSVWLFHE